MKPAPAQLAGRERISVKKYLIQTLREEANGGQTEVELRLTVDFDCTGCKKNGKVIYAEEASVTYLKDEPLPEGGK